MIAESCQDLRKIESLAACLIMISHDSGYVRKLMRLGKCFSNRGHNFHAFKVFKLASLIDKNYAEAFHKMAAEWRIKYYE